MSTLRESTRALVVFTCLLAVTQTSATSQESRLKPDQPAWIARSNENAQLLLQLQAKYSPEGAGRLGVEGLDEQISQLTPDRREKGRADWKTAAQELRRRLAAEKDPLVAQDLQIMIKAGDEGLRGLELNEKYDMPYFNVTQIVFSGLRALLDDQIPDNRRKAALVRLRKYVGMEPGYEPLADQAKARTADWSKPGQQGPAKIQVESDLSRADFFTNGIGQLFEKYKIEGYQEPFAKLKQQLTDYNAWVRKEILPKARTDFRRPPE